MRAVLWISILACYWLFNWSSLMCGPYNILVSRDFLLVLYLINVRCWELCLCLLSRLGLSREGSSFHTPSPTSSITALVASALAFEFGSSLSLSCTWWFHDPICNLSPYHIFFEFCVYVHINSFFSAITRENDDDSGALILRPKILSQSLLVIHPKSLIIPHFSASMLATWFLGKDANVRSSVFELHVFDMGIFST